MTTTSDPAHPMYLDEADVRSEMARVFDVCLECRRCASLCGSFPSLFDLLDRPGLHEAGDMTPEQQDAVVNECIHCGRCAVDCPYAPDLHDAEVDVPQLMLRARAMQYDNGLAPRWATARARRHGRLLRVARLGRRRIVGRVIGQRRRLAEWMQRRRPAVDAPAATSFAPTCLAEFSSSDAATGGVVCCGAPWLHAGDIVTFTRVAGACATAMAAEVRAGADVAVADPTCAHVLAHDTAHHLSDPARRADAELVARHIAETHPPAPGTPTPEK